MQRAFEYVLVAVNEPLTRVHCGGDGDGDGDDDRDHDEEDDESREV